MQPKFYFKILLFSLICCFSLNSLKSQIVAGDVPLGYQLVADSINVTWPFCDSPYHTYYLNLDCDTEQDIMMQTRLSCNPYYNSTYWFWDVQILDTSIEIAETYENASVSDLVCSHVQDGVIIEGTSNPTKPTALVWYHGPWLKINSRGIYHIPPGGFLEVAYLGYVPIRKKMNGEFQYGWIKLSTGSSYHYIPDKIYSHTIFPMYSVIRDTISCHDSYTFIDGLTLNNLIRDTTRDLLFTTLSGCDSLVRTYVVVPSNSTGNNFDTSSSRKPVVFIDGTSFTYL